MQIVWRNPHPVRRRHRSELLEVGSNSSIYAIQEFLSTGEHGFWSTICRLLDRIEKRGLISRFRDTKDRRTVIGKITAEGLELLARLDEPIQEVHRKHLGHLGRNRLWALTELLAAARGNVD